MQVLKNSCNLPFFLAPSPDLKSTNDGHNFWYNFFSSCGLAPDNCSTYADVFIQNNMRRDLLPLLDREYLNQMGITAIGDIMAILSHAKQVSQAFSLDHKRSIISLHLRKYDGNTIS